MKATYVQRGEAIDYINVGEEMIGAGDVITIGSRIGVAGAPIYKGQIGTVHVMGVFDLPKTEGEAIALGAKVFYTENGITATGGDVVAGWAVAEAAVDAETVRVKID